MYSERGAALRFIVLAVALACGCERCSDLNICNSTGSTAEVGGIWTIEGDGDRAGCADRRYNGSFKLGPSSKLAVEQVSQLITDVGPPPEAGNEDAAAREDRGRREAGAREARPPDVGRREASSADGSSVRDAARSDGLTPDGRHVTDGRLDALADRRPADRRRPLPGYHYLLRLHNPLPGFTLVGEVQGNCVTFETVESELTGTLHYQFKGKATSTRTIEGRFTGEGPTGCLSSGNFKVETR